MAKVHQLIDGERQQPTHWMDRRLCGLDKETRSLMLYLVFASFFTIVAFAGRPGENAYFASDNVARLVTETVSSTGKKYMDMVDLRDVWAFLQGPLLGLYDTAVPGEAGYGLQVFGYNFVLNGIRLRQLRINSAACTAQPEGLPSNITEACYFGITNSNEARAPYKPTLSNTTFIWTSGSAEEFPVWGKIDEYNPGGYIQDLPTRLSRASTQLATLKAETWLDIHTRGLFIQAPIYNPSLRLLLWLELLIEFPPGGGVVTTVTSKPVRLWRYLSAADKTLIFAEIVFLSLLIYVILLECFAIKRQGRAYFFHFWNYHQWLNLLIFIVSVAAHSSATFRADQQGVSNEDGSFVDFSHTVLLIAFEESVVAFNALLTYSRILMYFSNYPRFAHIYRALARAWWDILLFVLMLTCMLIAFGSAFYIAFGSELPAFRTFPLSMIQLLRMLYGDESVWWEMYEANRVLAGTLLLAFVLMLSFMSIHIFVAIIIHAYSIEKVAHEAEHEPLVLADEFDKGVDRLANYVAQRREKYMQEGAKIPDDVITDVIRKNKLGAERLGLRNLNDVYERYARDGVVAELQMARLQRDLLGAKSDEKPKAGSRPGSQPAPPTATTASERPPTSAEKAASRPGTTTVTEFSLEDVEGGRQVGGGGGMNTRAINDLKTQMSSINDKLNALTEFLLRGSDQTTTDRQLQTLSRKLDVMSEAIATLGSHQDTMPRDEARLDRKGALSYSVTPVERPSSSASHKYPGDRSTGLGR